MPVTFLVPARNEKCGGCPEPICFTTTFAWNLTSNRGFGDAIQFRFLEEEDADEDEDEAGGGEVETLQIEVLEAAFKVSRLEASGWTYDPDDFLSDE